MGPEILAELDAMGISTPTPIQALAIGPVLAGRDVIAKAETGTGKTLAFGAPILARLEPARTSILALLLCPTRELAQQVADVLQRLGKVRGLTVALVVGGEPMQPQVKALRAGTQVVVATPGRIIDLYEQRFVTFPWTEFAVLDEADRMLEIGFLDDVKKILNFLPKERQTLLFSATFPPELLRLAREHTINPIEVATALGMKTAATVEQFWIPVGEDERSDAVARLIATSEPDAIFLVFCKKRTDVGVMYRRLRRLPNAIHALHGGFDQAARFQVMEEFRAGKLKALIATDVAARGLDISHVTHVVNAFVPFEATEYAHRVGRTGRAGRSGRAITLVAPSDRRKWVTIRAKIDADVRETSLDEIAPFGSPRRNQSAPRSQPAARTREVVRPEVAPERPAPSATREDAPFGAGAAPVRRVPERKAPHAPVRHADARRERAPQASDIERERPRISERPRPSERSRPSERTSTSDRPRPSERPMPRERTASREEPFLPRERAVSRESSPPRDSSPSRERSPSREPSSREQMPARERSAPREDRRPVRETRPEVVPQRPRTAPPREHSEERVKGQAPQRAAATSHVTATPRPTPREEVPARAPHATQAPQKPVVKPQAPTKAATKATPSKPAAPASRAPEDSGDSWLEIAPLPRAPRSKAEAQPTPAKTSRQQTETREEAPQHQPARKKATRKTMGVNPAPKKPDIAPTPERAAEPESAPQLQARSQAKPKRTPSKKSATKKGAAKKPVAKPALAKKAATKQTTTKQAVTKQATPAIAAPAQATVKKATLKKASTKKAAKKSAKKATKKAPAVKKSKPEASDDNHPIR